MGFGAEEGTLSTISDLVSGGTLSRENEIDNKSIAELHEGRQARLLGGFQEDQFMNLQILNLAYVLP